MEFLSKYSLLNRNGEPQDDDGMEDPKPVRRFAKRRTYDIKDMILWCILVGSLLANVVLWWSSRHHEGKGGKWGDYGMSSKAYIPTDYAT